MSIARNLSLPGREEKRKNNESVTTQNGVQQTRSGLGRGGGHGEGARAARPRSARGRRQAAVSTSKNRAARPRPNFAGAAERGAVAARDGEGRAGCARFRLASLPHAARPHALPVGASCGGKCARKWHLHSSSHTCQHALRQRVLTPPHAAPKRSPACPLSSLAPCQTRPRRSRRALRANGCRAKLPGEAILP